MSASHDRFLGRTVSDYKIESKLREDRLGTIFLAHHTALDEHVAFRVLAPEYATDRGTLETLIRSAQALARTNSPYILRTFRMLKPQGEFCIAMRHAEGGELGQQIAELGPLPEKKAASIAHQIALGLVAAEKVGVRHGDLHPGNIHLTRAGRVKIAHFGLPTRCEVSNALDQTRVVQGTPEYMAPEVCRGNVAVDHRADLYSLGCLLFTMLTGAPPFREESIANLMVKHLLEEPPDLASKRSGLSPALQATVMKLLEKEPGHRFANAEELAERLAPLAGEARDKGRISQRLRAPVPVKLDRPQTGEFKIPDLPPPRRIAPAGQPQLKIIAAMVGVAALLFLVFLFRQSLFPKDNAGGEDEIIEQAVTTPVRFVGLMPADGETVHTLRFDLRGRVEELAGSSRTVDFVEVDGRKITLAADGGFSASLELEPGPNEIRLQAAREVLVMTVTVDPEPPAISFRTPLPGDLLGSESVRVVVEAGPTLRAVEVAGQTLEQTAPGEFSATLALAEGAHELTATARDALGTAWPTTISIEVDTSLPEIAIRSPDRAWVQSTALTVTVEVLSGEVERLQVNGVAARRRGDLYEAEIEVRANGTTTVEALLVDARGREARAQHEVQVDSEKPEIRVIAPADGALLGSMGLEVELDVPGEDIVEVRADGEVLRKLEGNYWGLLDLEDGRHTIALSAEDRAGNRTQREIEVRVDLTEPTLIVADVVLSYDTCFVTLQADEDLASVQVEIADPQPVRGRRVEIRHLLGGGQTTFFLTASDLAGNETDIEIDIPQKALDEEHLRRFTEGSEALERLRETPGDAALLAHAVRNLEVAATLSPYTAEAPYQLARAWALGGEPEKAVQALDRAFQNDFEDLEQLVDEPDLATVRYSLALQEVITRYFYLEKMIEGMTDAGLWWKPTNVQEAATHDVFLPVAARGALGIDFALIPPGEFLMGSPSSERGRDDDEERHTVTLSHAFYLAAHELTQARFESVMEYNPSLHEGEELPVDNLSWLEAIDFCNTLSSIEGLDPVYALEDEERDAGGRLLAAQVRYLGRERSGYRLPTEAEWEYACRAGSRDPFAFGRSLKDDEARFEADASAAVGSYAPNDWGLYDMHGNVFEWCWDVYGPLGDAAAVDPIGVMLEGDRVLRGGAWASPEADCRAAARQPEGALKPGTAGLRLVRSIVLETE